MTPPSGLKNILLEGEGVKVEFIQVLRAWKPEDKDRNLQGMKKVDFVAEYQDCYWLVEVKGGRKANIKGDWVPKARDSYTYLHLMKEDTKPIHYLVIASGPHKHPFSKLMKDLQNGILKEADEPWQRRYIQQCLVMDIAEANKWASELGFRIYRKP